MSIPPIPRRLARRIDRLSRRTHAFHRFAHHPLCEPYRNEVIRLGKRTYVCKGCSLIAAGFAVGIVVGLCVRPPLAWGGIALMSALVAGLLSMCARIPKLLGRFLPGTGLGLALWAGWPSALGSMIFLVTLGVLYRRRGVERGRCKTCAESPAKVCPGFARILRRERAFQRVVNRWLDDLPRSVA